MTGYLSWFLEILADLLRSEPIPGTPEHREAHFRVVKERNDERAKPPGERDETRLLELDKRVVRMRMNAAKSSKEKLRRGRDIYLQPPAEECCADCLLVRKRAAASNDARAAWNEQWEMVSPRRLEALEQGHPLPPLTLPYLELRLAEGVPEELPPSLNRCSACQDLLDKLIYYEQTMRLTPDDPP